MKTIAVEEKTYLIPWLPWDFFTWDNWRACDIWTTFNILCRKYDILNHRDILRKYAIGYCPSEELLIRPKVNEVAVMYLINEKMGWSHLRKDEFEGVFGNVG
jgi:hypothetical protein